VDFVEVVYCCCISSFRVDGKNIRDNMELFDDDNLLGKNFNTRKRKTQEHSSKVERNWFRNKCMQNQQKFMPVPRPQNRSGNHVKI
jgi:hypothetical protein